MNHRGIAPYASCRVGIDPSRKNGPRMIQSSCQRLVRSFLRDSCYKPSSR